MIRISGVNIPENKRIEVALTYIYGIGRSASLKILTEAQVDPSKKAKDLDTQELNKIQSIINQNYKVEGQLRQEVRSNIKRLKEINSWRGLRHSKRLPIKGRTRTNSRTIRGNVRRTVGSGRRPPPSPT